MVECTLVCVSGGILEVIMPSGELAYYAQRGISKLLPHQVENQRRRGKLNTSALGLKELPRGYELISEDYSVFNKSLLKEAKNYRG